MVWYYHSKLNIAQNEWHQYQKSLKQYLNELLAVEYVYIPKILSPRF